MISRIQAFNYRCFKELDIKLSQYNVLAGPNGSGKSTLLDIPRLLGDMLTRGLVPAFLTSPSAYDKNPRAQNFQELLYCGQGNEFGFAIEVELPQEIYEQAILRYFKNEELPQTGFYLRYEIFFEVDNKTEIKISQEFLNIIIADFIDQSLMIVPQIIQDGKIPIIIRCHQGETTFYGDRLRLIFDDDDGVYPRPKNEEKKLNFDDQEIALANIPRDTTQYLLAVWFRDLLEKNAIGYNPKYELLSRACPPGQGKTLREDGANLAWLVLDLKEKNPDLFESWVDHLIMALPNLLSIEAIKREEDYHAYLKLRYQGNYFVTSSGLSYGTLKILALTIVPYLSNLPQLIFIEEPEDGIHPRAIELILQSLSSVYDSQVWITTHSPIVLAHTELESVIIMRSDRGDGAKAILGEEHPRLKTWHKVSDLGSLFAAGVLS